MAFWLIAVLVALLALGTFLPLLRLEVWWIRDQDFPRLQYAGAALGLLIVQALILDWSDAFSWALAGVTLVCLVYQSFWIFPYTRLHAKEAKTVEPADGVGLLRIMGVNVLMS